MKFPISPDSNIAIAPPSGIGDALMFMTLAFQFHKNGNNVTLFNSALTSLQSWFPHVKILPTPDQDKILNTLTNFDFTIVGDHSFAEPFEKKLPNCTVLKKKLFNRNKTIAENLIDCGKKLFKLQILNANNGITPPDNSLTHRKYQTRVIIHTMSADPLKNWPAKKFITLAKKLKQAGYYPVFITSPNERAEWEIHLQGQFELPLFPSLDKLARFIFESGWMIGNDSGIGHLASNLGIPTLSLFRVKSKSQLWRPSWSYGMVVTPWLRIPGPHFRNLWKTFLTVNQVFNAFNRLVFTFKTRGNNHAK